MLINKFINSINSIIKFTFYSFVFFDIIIQVQCHDTDLINHITFHTDHNNFQLNSICNNILFGFHKTLPKAWEYLTIDFGETYDFGVTFHEFSLIFCINSKMLV